MSARCGIVAIAGAPNAGKSTLVNRLVGSKIAIVTPKAQTTRFNVRGICMEKETQLVLVDTPGIFTAQKSFEKSLVKEAWAGITDADAVLLIIDARAGIREDTLSVIQELKRKSKKPLCLALNKTDKVKKDALLSLAAALDKEAAFDRIFMISALTGDGVDDVRKYLAGVMPEGAWLYPADDLSDLPMNQLAAEITREKIFLLLSQELPYSIHVEPEAWEEKKESVRVSQCILVEKEGQKKIVIGKGGATLKRIGSSARRELEKLLEKRVHLQLFVKVKSDWKERYKA